MLLRKAVNIEGLFIKLYLWYLSYEMNHIELYQKYTAVCIFAESV